VEKDAQLEALDASFACWAGGEDGARYVDGLRRGLARRLEDDPG